MGGGAVLLREASWIFFEFPRTSFNGFVALWWRCACKVDRKRLKHLKMPVLKINFSIPRLLNFFSLFLILFWDFVKNAKIHLQLDYYKNNNIQESPTIFKKKKSSFISQIFSQILQNDPSFVFQYSKLNVREAGWTVYPSPSSLCFHKSQRGRTLQEWAGAGAPTVTLGAPVAATLASFLLLLFVIPPFLSFQHPFLRCLATSSFRVTS